MTDTPILAVVGATGTVGRVLCDLLSARRNVWSEIRLFAAPSSAGHTMQVCGEELTVQALTPESFAGVGVAIFDVPSHVATIWAPVAVDHGAVVIDNSGAFLGDSAVPLVIPEVNSAVVEPDPPSVIANPSSVTVALVVAIAALHHEYQLCELIVSSYQAASGAGQRGVDTLLDQVVKVSGDRELGSRAGNVRQAVGDDLGPFPAPLALNVVPWVGSPGPGEWSTEELNLRHETRRVLALPDLKVAATCVQVPVATGDSLAIHAVFRAEVEAERARELVRHAPGAILVDDPHAGEFPMPVDAAGTDPIWVGRVRRSVDDPRALDLFVTADNLRKGGALNLIQLAELVRRGANRR